MKQSKFSFINFIVIAFTSIELLAPANAKTFSFNCIPNADIANMVKKQSGEDAFEFKLDIVGPIATMTVGKSTFKFQYDQDYGEGDELSAYYKNTDGASIRYFYNNGVAVVMNQKIITAGECIPIKKK